MEFKPVKMEINYTGGMSFSATTNTGLLIPIDAHVHLGGEGTIPNPIDYLFASLGGCIGIKILLSFRDYGYTPEFLTIETYATRKQSLPATFDTIHHIITMKGDFDDMIIAQILARTMTLLCPIAVILGESAQMTWEHRIIE